MPNKGVPPRRWGSQWGAGLAAGLGKLSSRLDEHRAEDAAEPPAQAPAVEAAPEVHVPPPPAYAPAVRAPRQPSAAVPWGVRVAAEVAWRFLVLAGALYLLMRAISSVQLVVLSFAASLLITALLQPTVARLKRMGMPRGPATAVAFITGFVVMGLVGWFVVWQVMENTDTLSNRVQAGIGELKSWLLHSPLHVTENQINQVTKNLQHAIGTNAEQITSAGLEGVTVVIDLFTGIFLAMFCTLFLLYDGAGVWKWLLKLFPRDARDGIAGAGPRAWRTLTLYVRGTVIVAFIDAVCIGVGIFFLGVPMAVPLAVVIFLGSFVPLVGAVASGALAMIVALVSEGPFTMLMVLAVVLAVQQIEGHILQPFILGRAVRVHPLAVVLSVASGSLIAGIGGAVVAVPLVAVTNTVVGYLRQHSREVALRTALAASTAEPSGSSEPQARDERDERDAPGPSSSAVATAEPAAEEG
ncbi:MULTISPECIES: AI-2E family transporter [Streptomycetaceae]|uniref:Integral membrane protein n=1 Tax=Streptantibioticus cattleyicolor (strain ATCC 35852 / DSM 46488 / JCM 4925 / NBRC 14057 / NRRL 8057) TaxID=1003195 RepID=F8K2G2_STREN|nr:MULTISPECIES: AI-2E family transporter [Streptomycetaceae]AEW96253.1 integral membrane protein [Streptantibioticus cattleyicolor NRRL 8057 = DSM 46488]MYS60773.1 AI-2E family transporter [Streptomyces sp. SID5468]CCB76593.1 Integral membrane protein [Streptantibioticus cattleyicolor NRRL 8057 = DSM 46488]